MPAPSDSKYPQATESQALALKEQGIEEGFIEKLRSLKYTFRPDISDRAALERNFREKFEALNRVRLTDSEFQRLLDELITPDVFTAARVLREKNDFTRDDGTPLAYTLVNIKDWCKNDFEVVHQLRINTDYSHHRYDVILLINGVPVAQVELKTLSANHRTQNVSNPEKVESNRRQSRCSPVGVVGNFAYPTQGRRSSHHCWAECGNPVGVHGTPRALLFCAGGRDMSATPFQTSTNLVVMKRGKLTRVPAQTLRKTASNGAKK